MPFTNSNFKTCFLFNAPLAWVCYGGSESLLSCRAEGEWVTATVCMGGVWARRGERRQTGNWTRLLNGPQPPPVPDGRGGEGGHVGNVGEWQPTWAACGREGAHVASLHMKDFLRRERGRVSWGKTAKFDVWRNGIGLEKRKELQPKGSEWMQGIVVKGRTRISDNPATALISTHAPHCERAGDPAMAATWRSSLTCLAFAWFTKLLIHLSLLPQRIHGRRAGEFRLSHGHTSNKFATIFIYCIYIFH